MVIGQMTCFFTREIKTHLVPTVDIHDTLFDIWENAERRLRGGLNNIKECLE